MSMYGRAASQAFAPIAAIVATLFLIAVSPTVAQDAEDELGSWFIWNGTVRFSKRWSLFTEAQLRTFEVASNFNEFFVRAAGQYHLSPKALVAVGYLRSDVSPFQDDQTLETTEHRIYEQFTISHQWARSIFEHRYRLEQRWIETNTGTDRRDRLRYRLQITTPLNRASMEPGAWFFNFYDEIFINFDSLRTFDQNRFYVAGGHQFTKLSNLQFGLLWQARTSADFFRLQLFYTHNFDLRED